VTVNRKFDELATRPSESTPDEPADGLCLDISIRTITAFQIFH